MSFKAKKRNELEMDELNIEFHLNTSLEANGVNVSEDLINRTLNAIRMQDAENSSDTKEELQCKKPIPLYRYTRTLVTAVAAVLILVVGINALGLLNPHKKMDMAIQEESSNYSRSENAGIANNESAIAGDAADYDMGSADEAKTDLQMTYKLDSEDKEGSGMTQNADNFLPENTEEILGNGSEENDSMLLQREYTRTFTDITIIEPVDVSSITIISKASGDIRTITEQEQIDQFYLVMEKHVFTNDAGDDTAVQYIVKLAGKDSDSQIIIGEYAVTVDNTYNETTSHSIYSTADQSMLLEDLTELLAE